MANPEPPEAALALWLADRAVARSVAFIARSETRLDRLARACAGFCARRAELLVLPPWDVLPYDRVAPSAAIVGRRVATLERLTTAPGLPRLVLTSPDAILQRVPPKRTWSDPALVLVPGEAVDLNEFRVRLGERGYHLGETVVEPGEVAFRDRIVDVFPAAAPQPVRISLEGGCIAGMYWFDPATQRRLDPADHVTLHQAVEFPLDPDEAAHALDAGDAPAPLPSGRLVPVFDYLDGFDLVVDDAVEARWAALREQAQDAYEASRRLIRVAADPRGVLPRPDRLFLTVAQAEAACSARVQADVEGAPEPTPRRTSELIRRARGSDIPVVIAAPGDPAPLAASLARRGLDARVAASWADATERGPAAVACIALDIETGFRTSSVLVLPAAQLVRARGTNGASLGRADVAPRLGDVVVHAEHGAARLVALKPVETDGMAEERLALAFQGGAELLVHTSELDRIWRYGAEGTLDRIGGEAWQAKRQAIDAEIASVAEQLARQAASRAARTGPSIDLEQGKQGRVTYDRLARRFAYALSIDQQAAVDDVLADLRRGSPPMDRLVCGDVGFGKTEVALRAAAAVALCGYQVAVVAPTTVLARQHLDTFRRRFAGSGIPVEPLGPASDPASRAVRDGLADGRIGIVVGTQGLASPSVRFARLGLVVIDEEQRLGEAMKQALGEKGGTPVHTLCMTATPIPRTMQTALVGLREVSVIATAPVRRQPTRTFVVPFDPVVVHDALTRERARGGQSFIVCPRITDLAAMAERIAELAPTLHVVQAHGRLKPQALDQAVVGFAEGAGDVLLATDIIEAGLDIPRANTILVMHADRFGLAQLHQIRGRVGRGARRGVAYLMTEPGRRLTGATRARLHALEAMSQLGAGVAISAADLDQRGAGEMFGEAQAGHVSELGTELYQHMLLQAIRAQRGEPPAPPVPELHVGITGRIPDELAPEPDLRLSLYHRLARLQGTEQVDAFAEELEDRFGDTPPGLSALLTLARLRCLCAAAGISRLDLGPRGASFRAEGPFALSELHARLGGIVRGDRLVSDVAGSTQVERVASLTADLTG